MNCNQCGAELKVGAKFCPKCGTASASATELSPCVSCSKPLKPGAKFCPHCGASQLTKPAAVSDQRSKAKSVQSVATQPVGEVAATGERGGFSAQTLAEAQPKSAAKPAPVETAAAASLSKTRTQADPAPVMPVNLGQAKKSAPSNPQEHKALHPNALPSKQAAQKRKSWPLWLAGGIAIAAAGAGGAWYFHLVPGTSPQAAVAEETQAASPPLPVETADPPVDAKPAPVEEATPLEPPAAAMDQPPIEESAQALAPPKPAQPKALAKPSQPAISRGQPAVSRTPAWASPQGISSAPLSSGQPAQSESQRDGVVNEQTQDAVAESQAKTKDPFAKCRKLTGIIERKWCEEKTRFKICQGKWGTTAECPKYEDNSENQF